MDGGEAHSGGDGGDAEEPAAVNLADLVPRNDIRLVCLRSASMPSSAVRSANSVWVNVIKQTNNCLLRFSSMRQPSWQIWGLLPFFSDQARTSVVTGSDNGSDGWGDFLWADSWEIMSRDAFSGPGP